MLLTVPLLLLGLLPHYTQAPLRICTSLAHLRAAFSRQAR